MVQKEKHLNKDKSILNVVQFYNETIDDNVKYLNKINLSASNLNREDFTTAIQIANVSEDDKELTLLKSPFKKIKKKKKKSKMVIIDGAQSSKYVTIQKNLKNMEDLKKNIFKEQSNEIHNDSNMISTIYNSRISKVHKEEYPELVKKSLKNKKREQKKAIKVVTHNDVMLQKKSNKHKRQTTDKEYSKNDSPQSVDINVETCYDSNNYIGEDFRNKLEHFDSRDDHPSEYRDITDTVMYLGQYCNQIFNNANGIFIHENVLTGNIPLQCDVCFRTFSYKSKLYVHKRTHTGEKPYTCNVCGQSFSQKGSLVIHKRTHTGEKPYACNVCCQSFSQKGSLVIHKRTHTGEKPYACNYCGRSFSLHGNLVTHIRTHTGEKPYTCNVCGQSFSQKGTLVTHKRTHTGEKPYACNVCGRSFTQKKSCVIHYRIHTGERPFECDYCEKKFSASSDRSKHMRRIHT
ncbi:zinc finger protein 300-like [Acyrthosiphon pisum]|uniref:C2H2-type domain-containing protein n=1 Tax=Acyrthosiphon pisum TaxID=7029 RepID=A0A8R2NNJ7_ACYPI|nr:zinc finger protein 300-like [Acyrthosiphon pisum]|eukprot:XP_003243653.2 PREDICTED: zinc finger protein 300-like [Acyrthosiphon pisum]